MNLLQINTAIQEINDKGQVSDGYHTFGELYEARCLLFTLLVKSGRYPCWKARANHDGERWEGWFVAGINPKAGEQITFHLPMKYWDMMKNATEFDVNPYFDGHSSGDVLSRMERLALSSQ